MALTLDDLLDTVRESRQHFLKHLAGLNDAQYHWQPYPGCKSISETLAHLLCDDRTALKTIETNAQPNWEIDYAETERDPARLQALLAESHPALVNFLKTRFSDAPLDTEVNLFGNPLKLGIAVSHLTAEDFYHAGQVAFIRMATDPTWDYYHAVYGIKE